MLFCFTHTKSYNRFLKTCIVKSLFEGYCMTNSRPLSFCYTNVAYKHGQTASIQLKKPELYIIRKKYSESRWELIPRAWEQIPRTGEKIRGKKGLMIIWEKRIINWTGTNKQKNHSRDQRETRKHELWGKSASKEQCQRTGSQGRGRWLDFGTRRGRGTQ